MKIIGFAGKGRVGKTTTALNFSAWINKEYPDVHVEILPFALPLKEDVASAAGYSSWYHYKNEHPKEYRKVCQTRGEEARKANPNHWVDLWSEKLELLRKMEECGGKERVILVDDVRYENELERIHSLDGKVTFISHGLRKLEDSKAFWRLHPSEVMANNLEKSFSEAEARQYTLFAPIDYLLINDFDTVEEYEESLEDLYPLIMGKLNDVP